MMEYGKGGAMNKSTSSFSVVLIPALLMWFVSAGPCFSATSAERESLRGVQALRVLVKAAFPDEAARALGITEEQLRADAEQTLRKAGIHVADHAGPYLLLSVSILSISHPKVQGTFTYVYTAQLKFRQGAVIDSNGIRASVITWDETRFGASTPTQRLNALIRQSINALVGAFVSDFHAANPMPAGP
jgi:L-lactate permease